MMRDVWVELNENSEIKVEEDSRYILDISNLGTEKKYALHLIFEKEGVNAEIVGVFRVQANESINLTTTADHLVPHTSCLTKVKTVLEEGARSNYVGNIVIRKTAQQTSSFLEDRVLVLGESVVNNSSPNLQIDANDVKASHGATTGRVSEEELFYLMSRGLSRREAEDLIVEGFFHEMVSGISDVKIKKELYDRLSYSK